MVLFKGFLRIILGNINRSYNKKRFSNQKENNNIIVFNTALHTDNLGDQIIMLYCNNVLEEMFRSKHKINISTHRIPDKGEQIQCVNTKIKIVCGTNLLTSNIENWWNWRLPDGFKKKRFLKNVILLGVGWDAYQDPCSEYSKFIYKSILNASIMHSVRDQYTLNQLKKAGIDNVINTGCPTTWRLTPEFCKEIPTKRAKNVITTITDYRRDPLNDRLMLEILSENYENVWLWLQGKRDFEYLNELKIPKKIQIIDRELKLYEEKLKTEKVDYVGTRLHAGIFALNHKVRSLIIAVDNRAIEIAKDINLPIIKRENIIFGLNEWINSEFITDIYIHKKEIERFKSQFKGINDR